MDRKVVDFKMNVLSDWSLKGFIRGLLIDVSRDMTFDDKYDADFIAKFGQRSTHNDSKRKSDRKKILDDYSDVLKHAGMEQECKRLKKEKSDGKKKVVTDVELATLLISARRAEFKKLIRVTENKQPVTVESKDGVIKVEENQKVKCLTDVQESSTPAMTECSATQEVPESPTIPIDTSNVVKPDRKRNIFRRIGRFFRRRSGRQ